MSTGGNAHSRASNTFSNNTINFSRRSRGEVIALNQANHLTFTLYSSSISPAYPKQNLLQAWKLHWYGPHLLQISTVRYCSTENVLVEAFRPGYPRLAAFMDSDRSLCAFKQFGRLHARILLCKQDEILELQEQLDELDRNEETSYFLQTRRHDHNTHRRDLLSKVGRELLEYST